MALNFPDSPSIGDTYNDTTSGFAYEWDGTIWKSLYNAGGNADISVDTTPQLGGDLDLNSKNITGTGNINVTGIVTTTELHVGVDTGFFTEDLVVNGDARITGILSIGTATIILDPTANKIQIGTGITLDANTNTIEVGGSKIADTSGNAEYSGIVTAASFSGDGSNLTGVGGTVAISTTAPSSPSVGDLWFDPDYGRTLIYYNDGDSSQWIDASPVATTISDASDLTVTNGINVTGVSTFSGDANIGTGGTTAFFDVSSGRFGIGTVSPEDSLHIKSNSGAIRLENTVVSNNDSTIAYDNTDLAFHVDPNNVRGSSNITFSGDGNERMRLDSNGRLGIGTDAPDRKLHVAGDWIRVDDGYGLDTSGSTEKVKLDNGYIALTTASLERMRLDSSGNIGIGTAGPGGKLHVGSAAATAGWQIRTDSIGLSNESGFYRDASDNYEVVLRNGSGGLSFIKNDGGASTANLIFNVQGSERMRLDSSGRLLAGTSSSPTAGQAQYGFLRTIGNTLGSTSYGVISVGRGAAASSGLTVGNNMGTITFTDSIGGEFARIQAATDATTSSSSYPGNLRFYTTPVGGTSPSERMRLFSDGVIAVNTTSGWFSRYFVVESTSAGGGTAAFLASNSGVYPVSVANYAASGDNNFIGFWTDSRSSPTQRGDIDYNRAAGQVRYNVTSDRRLKSNIEPAESAINLLSSIQVRSYTWTESQYKVDYGFVAQELHNHVPDAVKQGDDGDEVVDAWSIDNSKLVPVLTKALQEAIAKIETLESEVAALKNG